MEIIFFIKKKDRTMCAQKKIFTALGLVSGKDQIALKVKRKRYREKQPKIDSGTHCSAWKPENSKVGSSEYYVLIQKCELNCIWIKKTLACTENSWVLAINSLL